MSTRLTILCARLAAARWPAPPSDTGRRDRPTEAGFEIAQSMGIALLGLVVAAAFATALETLGVDVIDRIRTELGL